MVAHGLSCSSARGVFPDQGPNLRLLDMDSYPLCHQGSSDSRFLLGGGRVPWVKWKGPQGGNVRSNVLHLWVPREEGLPHARPPGIWINSSWLKFLPLVGDAVAPRVGAGGPEAWRAHGVYQRAQCSVGAAGHCPCLVWRVELGGGQVTCTLIPGDLRAEGISWCPQAPACCPVSTSGLRQSKGCSHTADSFCCSQQGWVTSLGRARLLPLGAHDVQCTEPNLPPPHPGPPTNHRSHGCDL